MIPQLVLLALASSFAPAITHAAVIVEGDEWPHFGGYYQSTSATTFSGNGGVLSSFSMTPSASSTPLPFDVFYELSVDKNQTWTPADSSTRLAFVPVPEPAASLPVGLGVLMLAAPRR